MLVIHEWTARWVQNSNLQSPLVNLSSVRAVTRFSAVLLRIEVLSADESSSLAVLCEFGHNGSCDLGSETVLRTTGRWQIGFSRGDLDEQTTARITLTAAGRLRLAASLHLVDGGEDVPEWL